MTLKGSFPPKAAVWVRPIPAIKSLKPLRSGVTAAIQLSRGSTTPRNRSSERKFSMGGVSAIQEC